MSPEVKLADIASLVALSDKDVVRHWRRWYEASTNRVMPLYPPPLAQMLRDLVAATLETSPAYPHMCRDGHEEIGWRGDGEMCPVCVAKARTTDAHDVAIVADAAGWYAEYECSDHEQAVVIKAACARLKPLPESQV